MTKEDIKTLSTDDKIAFWIAVFFGEICEMVEALKKKSTDATTLGTLVSNKIEEFEHQIVYCTIDRCKESALNAQTNKQDTNRNVPEVQA